jgi:glyoxalase family protein
MRLAGLHHVTMITGDAQRLVDFYAGTLGLRLVKLTVNFDAPDAYHLYFGSETGAPGSILTWFEFAGAAPGRPGAGMIHVIELAVPAAPSLDFWQARLAGAGLEAARVAPERLELADPDGLALALVAADPGALPLAAIHPEIPAEHAIGGVAGARAYAEDPGGAAPLVTDTLGFVAGARPGEYALRAPARPVAWGYDPAPPARGLQGAGTVHHIAWACEDADQLVWQARVHEAGGHVTGVRDRDYFRSIYFREPRGVLFEIATLGPGFAVDEDPAHLGEALRLPAQHEHLRAQLEAALRPVVNLRSGAAAS